MFIDEAHRSVAKDLGTYLMAAVPKATIIGFTGTPIARTTQGEGTFKIFGTQDERGYLDKYSIAESIADETTLPIKHMMAPSEMTVPAEQLNKEFFELAEGEGVTDVEELNKVLDRAVGLRTFLLADDRIEKVAAFIAEHFKENVLPLGYKAFVVGVNREACAKYKRALDKLLPPEWSVPVYTDNVADVVDRPLVAALQLSPEREEQVRQLFKKPAENPKILIVTDKLLTGYDAPPLYCLYLDKPMRDHVLLQSIARVNRPYVDANGVQKRVGFVADLAYKTRRLIEESAEQQGLGRLTKSVVFDVATLQALRGEKGPDEGKVLNLVRGLQHEMDEDAAVAPILQPLKERAERVLRDMEERRTTGLAAMDLLATLAADKEAAMKAARDSGLSARAFAVAWVLRDDASIKAAGTDAMALAREAEELLGRFPNAAVNADEQRRLRAALYKPVLALPAEERARVVDLIVKLLLAGAEE